MPKLSFGIKTIQYFPYENILRVWHEADTIPTIEHGWLLDHPMPYGKVDPSGPCLDGWTTLSALAGETKRIRLGLMVASNANQTPPQLAKRASTFDVVSHGRLEFGFGAGGVEREEPAYGTICYPPGERVRRLDEACVIIKRIWTEPVVNHDGRYYHFHETYCEPKPVQKPMPRFIIGGQGEQLLLRVVAKHADVWNFPGRGDLERVPDYKRKNEVLDGYCAAIGRDPSTILRSMQLQIDSHDDPAAARHALQEYIAVGASHIILNLRTLDDGIAHWLNQHIIEPLLDSSGV